MSGILLTGRLEESCKLVRIIRLGMKGLLGDLKVCLPQLELIQKLGENNVWELCSTQLVILFSQFLFLCQSSLWL